MADKIEVTGSPGTATQAEGPHQFGLAAAMALIVGSFIWYSRNTGPSFWVYWAPFFLAAGALLLGIPVFQGQRRHMTQPGPVPPYR